MPKAVLKFNLPEENYEFKSACQAQDFRLVLSEFDNWLRGKIKYSQESEEKIQAYDETRQHLFSLCNDFNVNIHE